jgi:hypothetical protein
MGNIGHGELYFYTPKTDNFRELFLKRTAINEKQDYEEV